MEPNQFVQIPGALAILLAYILLQLGRLRADSRTFAAMNFGGASLLAFEAARTQQWGFLLLEGTWAIVSLIALFRRSPPRS